MRLDSFKTKTKYNLVHNYCICPTNVCNTMHYFKWELMWYLRLNKQKIQCVVNSGSTWTESYCLLRHWFQWLLIQKILLIPFVRWQNWILRPRGNGACAHFNSLEPVFGVSTCIHTVTVKQDPYIWNFRKNFQYRNTC